MATSAPAGLHPSAPHHIPSFMPDAFGNDPLTVIVGVFLVLLLLALGLFYFRLHALPEQMAHGVNPAQLQIVSMLALLALITHNNLFWVIALLLAAIQLPDYATPMENIVKELKAANRIRRKG